MECCGWMPAAFLWFEVGYSWISFIVRQMLTHTLCSCRWYANSHIVCVCLRVCIYWQITNVISSLMINGQIVGYNIFTVSNGASSAFIIQGDHKTAWIFSYCGYKFSYTGFTYLTLIKCWRWSRVCRHAWKYIRRVFLFSKARTDSLLRYVLN